MAVSTEKRREEIIRTINREGKVTVKDLAKAYAISEVSVRKDLEFLEMQGHLSRVHGGAVAVGKLYVNMDLGERFKTNAPLKKRLAELVKTLIDDNDTLMINAGTTITYILHAIRNKKNIRIVTNSLQNASEASTYPNFSVILLGGELDPKYQFTYGEDALKQLESYHATKCILSIDGVSADEGLTLYYRNEASLAKKMIDCSDSLIVASDSSKIGKRAFARITDTAKTHVLVTSEEADEAEIKKIEALGVRVMK